MSIKQQSNAGIYELMVKKQLLQQQLRAVDSRCGKLAAVVADKHKAKQQQLNSAAARKRPSCLEADSTNQRLDNAQQLQREQRSPGLQKPTLFTPGGSIDMMHRKNLLRQTQLELNKAARRQSRQPSKPAIHRPPPGAPPLFLSRYAMGDIPCSVSVDLTHRCSE